MWWNSNASGDQVRETLYYFTDFNLTWSPLLCDIALHAPSGGAFATHPIGGVLAGIFLELPIVIFGLLMYCAAVLAWLLVGVRIVVPASIVVLMVLVTTRVVGQLVINIGSHLGRDLAEHFHHFVHLLLLVLLEGIGNLCDDPCSFGNLFEVLWHLVTLLKWQHW